MKITKKYYILGGLVLILAAATFFWLNSRSNYDNFAKCLTEKGAVMYGTTTCHFCAQQKDLFGKSFKYINFVDCSYQDYQGITGYPTWVYNGENYVGKQNLDVLSMITGCPLNEND